MISTLKRIVPESIRRKLKRTIYKRDYHRYRSALRPHIWRHKQPTLDFNAIKNGLPNSGPVSVETTEKIESAHQIIDRFPDATRRQLDELVGFEGFALDDAIFDPVSQAHELWSFAPLAGFLAQFCYTHYQQPSILELGRGPAHLFFFFRDLGIWNYIGIDGNPFFLKLNPYLTGFEGHFLQLNLQEEIHLYHQEEPQCFDIICSFEVLEHIREDKVNHFIQTMVHHMHADSVVFCTASLQENMDVHVLVQDRTWWLNRFAQFDLVPHPDEAELIKEVGSHHPFNWTPEITNLFAVIRKKS